MAEYQDELASDSEDKKKIEKAEKAAKRKASKWRKRKADLVAGTNKAKLRRDQQFSGLQDFRWQVTKYQRKNSRLCWAFSCGAVS